MMFDVSRWSLTYLRRAGGDQQADHFAHIIVGKPAFFQSSNVYLLERFFQGQLSQELENIHTLEIGGFLASGILHDACGI
jgi:hypothetical protein